MLDRFYLCSRQIDVKTLNLYVAQRHLEGLKNESDLNFVRLSGPDNIPYLTLSSSRIKSNMTLVLFGHYIINDDVISG